MKITRRQLRKIIIESITEISDAGQEAVSAAEMSALASFATAGGGALAASAALGLSGAAGPVSAVIAIIGAGILSVQTLKEVDKAERKATAKRMSDILKRTMAMSLKSMREKGLSDDDARKAHRIIMQGDAKEIESAIKEGIVDIDLNSLERVRRDMQSSASSEYVDSEAIDKMIDELKDKLFS